MKRCVPPLLVLITMGILSTDAFGVLIPFSKERIAANGKHCVHGYDGNLGQVGVYYAGDASAFNETIRGAGRSETEEAFRPPYASKTVILHPGPMVVPEYVAKNDNISADWLITTWRGDHRGQSGWHMQVDVWLGGRIKLDALQIPEDFTVESGREIEDFVARRKKQDK